MVKNFSLRQSKVAVTHLSTGCGKSIKYRRPGCPNILEAESMSEAKEPYDTARNLNLKVDAGLSGFSKVSVVIYFNFADDDLYPM